MWQTKYLPSFFIAATAAAVMLAGTASYAEEDAFAGLSQDSQMSKNDMDGSAGLGIDVDQMDNTNGTNIANIAEDNQNNYVSAENNAYGQINYNPYCLEYCDAPHLGSAGNVSITGNAFDHFHGINNAIYDAGNGNILSAGVSVSFSVFYPTQIIGADAP